MLTHRWGLFILLFVTSYVACIWTKNDLPLLWALLPPIAVRLADAVCYFCGCCRTKRPRRPRAPASDRDPRLDGAN
jgi:CDP-diglyceride synthetase